MSHSYGIGQSKKLSNLLSCFYSGLICPFALVAVAEADDRDFELLPYLPHSFFLLNEPTTTEMKFVFFVDWQNKNNNKKMILIIFFSRISTYPTSLKIFCNCASLA